MKRVGLPGQDGTFDFNRTGVPGVPGSSQNRPLKVLFRSKSTALKLLLKAKNLKDDDQFNVSFIVTESREKSRTQNLVEQLRAKRAENPDKKFYKLHKSIRSNS